MPYPRTEHEHQILQDYARGNVNKAELARRYSVNRKTVHAVLSRYGIQESEQSKLGRMKSDSNDLTKAMLRFINRSPSTPELVAHRQEMVPGVGCV
jgi:transposase-like protein